MHIHSMLPNAYYLSVRARCGCLIACWSADLASLNVGVVFVQICRDGTWWQTHKDSWAMDNGQYSVGA